MKTLLLLLICLLLTRHLDLKAFEIAPLHDFSQCPMSEVDFIKEMQNKVVGPQDDPSYEDTYLQLRSWGTQWFASSSKVMNLDDLSNQKLCLGLYWDTPANAKADPEFHLYFGYNRFLQLQGARFGGEKYWGAMLMMAHEFGHNLQFGHGISYSNQSTAKAQELNADCLAGYIMDAYLRNKVKDPNQYINSLGKEISLMGDYATTHPQHHGTPRDREDAFKKGVSLSIQYQIMRSVGQAPFSKTLVQSCSN